MAKRPGSALMFDEEEVRLTNPPAFLPRLLRVICFRKQITNDEFNNRTSKNWKAQHPNNSAKDCSVKVSALRNFSLDKKLTFNYMANVLYYLGFDIESVSITLVERTTQKRMEFSTTETVESMKAQIESEKPVGLSSI